MNFPSIKSPSYPLSEKYEDTSIRSEFEDGSQQSRRKFTRSRRTYVLMWNALSNADYVTLTDFVKNDAKFGAVAFNWTHPLTSEVIEVRIADFPEWKCDLLNYWSGEMTLKEV